MKWSMPTNTLKSLGAQRAIGTLVGGHCSGKFRQGWGLVSSNAHPTKSVLLHSAMFGSWKPAMDTLVGGHCSGESWQDWKLVSSNAHPTKSVLQNAFA